MARVTSGPHTRRAAQACAEGGARPSRIEEQALSPRQGVAASRDGLLDDRPQAEERENRSLAIIRINAAARENGMTYSQLIHGLKLANVDLDRKSLSELAVREPSAFTVVVQAAKSAVGA